MKQCGGSGQITIRRDDPRGNNRPESTASVTMMSCPGCPDCAPASDEAREGGMTAGSGVEKWVTVKLDKGVGDHKGGVAELVPGPHPYVWIGDREGCYGVLSEEALGRLFRAAT